MQAKAVSKVSQNRLIPKSTDNIPRHLNEARMKLVSVLYHIQGIYPLRISILFIELDTSIFFISKLNGSRD